MSRRRAPDQPAVLTIGHRNRSLEAFLDLLCARRRACRGCADDPALAPQYAIRSGDVAALIAAHGYWLHPHARIGGLRRARPDSLNMGRRNASCRGFADHMQTPEFEVELKRLMRTTAEKRLALMRAEAVPWRCHRSLIAVALTVRGIAAAHAGFAVKQESAKDIRAAGHAIVDDGAYTVNPQTTARISLVHWPRLSPRARWSEGSR